MLYENQRFIEKFELSKLERDTYPLVDIFASKASYAVLEHEVANSGGPPIVIEQAMECITSQGNVIWGAIQLHPVIESNHTVIILDDISAQIQIQEDLDKAKNILKAADSERTRLLANISHELRTPLTSIRGMLSNIGLSHPPKITHDEWSIMLHAADSLNEVIEEMLLFAQDPDKQLQSNETAVNLPEFISQIFAMMKAQHQHTQHISFELALAKDLPTYIRIDPYHLQQIIFNLVTNAFKFTSEGYVRLDVYSNGAKQGDEFVLCIEVCDSGCGIAQDKLTNIFMPFQQLNNKATRSAGGLGLGLSIVQKLVTMMQGTVSVTSQPQDGSCFWVTLPVDIAEVDTADYALTQQPNDVLAPTGLHILLVEDNEVNADIIARHLHKFDNTVTKSVNGMLALDVLLQESFDIVLMDVQMPVMDGFTASKHIRRSEKIMQQQDKHLPILGLTADATKYAHNQCINAGMNAVVNKPVVFEELYTAILHHVKHAQSVSSSPEGSVNDSLSAAPDSSAELDFLAEFCTSDDEQIRMAKVINIASAMNYAEDDHAFYQDCVRFMLPSVRKVASSLRLPKSEINCEELAFEVHQLGSAAGMVGALKLAESAKQVSHDFEQTGKCDDEALNNLATQLDAFIDVAALIVVEMEKTESSTDGNK